jgi:hypothetical protein
MVGSGPALAMLMPWPFTKSSAAASVKMGLEAEIMPVVLALDPLAPKSRLTFKIRSSGPVAKAEGSMIPVAISPCAGGLFSQLMPTAAP